MGEDADEGCSGFIRKELSLTFRHSLFSPLNRTVSLIDLSQYILSLSPVFPFRSSYIWSSYPSYPLPGLTKLYYLSQLGFWFHQVLILNIEEKRGDHWMMFTHHMVTICLVGGSYWTNFTRIGVVIHTLMDFCDILLAVSGARSNLGVGVCGGQKPSHSRISMREMMLERTHLDSDARFEDEQTRSSSLMLTISPASHPQQLAKMLRYLGLTTATDITFVLFLVSWLITRQIGFFGLFLSTMIKAPQFLDMRWEPENGYYANWTVLRTFQVLLGLLQVMSAIWFFLACRVAYRVVRGLGAEDSRSDDEG